jgi:hypothetical protein
MSDVLVQLYFMLIISVYFSPKYANIVKEIRNIHVH